MHRWGRVSKGVATAVAGGCKSVWGGPSGLRRGSSVRPTSERARSKGPQRVCAPPIRGAHRRLPRCRAVVHWWRIHNSGALCLSVDVHHRGIGRLSGTNRFLTRAADRCAATSAVRRAVTKRFLTSAAGARPETLRPGAPHRRRRTGPASPDLRPPAPTLTHARTPASRAAPPMRLGCTSGVELVHRRRRTGAEEVHGKRTIGA